MTTSLTTAAGRRVEAEWPLTASPRGVVREPTVINWYLITLALIYVIWSWVHLPSSIWVRSLLACYLIWRMQPDVIIPYMLTGVQLRLSLRAGLDSLEEFGAAENLAQSLTGFEQYAFTVPCVLYAVRTFFAAVSTNAPRRAEFPFGLYFLYLVGMLFVIAGGLAASGKGGWTAGIRSYCLVSLYFYGLLLPGLSHRQMTKLAVAFSIFGMTVLLMKISVGFGSRQLWLLLPFAGSFAPILLFRGARLQALVAASIYSALGLGVAINATFTVLLQWVWNTIAGVCLGPLRSQAARGTIATVLTYSLFVFSLGLLFYGAFAHDPTRDAMEASRSGATLDKMKYKLTGDRGPIWWGAMQELVVNPTLCGVPTPTFPMVSHGKEVVWTVSTHNIVLDPLLRLGIVAGPILLLVLVSAVRVSRNAIAWDGSVGVTVLALAVMSNIVLGGATLPYMLNDREAEHMMMTAGLLGAYGIRRASGRGRASSAPPDPYVCAQTLPAA
jgi:hypothetical protein